MEDFLKSALVFVNDLNFVFYGASLLGMLLYFFRAREANRIRRFTPFPIEREEASAMLRDSLVIVAILVAIFATTFYIDRILLPSAEGPTESEFAVEPPPTMTPTAPAIGAAPVPTDTATIEAAPVPIDTATIEAAPVATDTAPIDATATPEASPTSEPTATTTPTLTPAPTTPPTTTPAPTVTVLPTFPPTNTPTPIPASPIPTRPPEPTTPPVPAASCNTPGVRISSPAHGQVVSGNVSIFGTASIDRFQFYKVEFGQGGNPGAFSAIGDVVRQPVQDGLLATWSAGSFSSGIWTLRLTAVDATGNFPPPCDIRVVIP